MPYLIGIVLSVAVAVFARYVGFDRDRAFYPTVIIVVAAYYVLFAAMTGSVHMASALLKCQPRLSGTTAESEIPGPGLASISVPWSRLLIPTGARIW